MEIPEERDPWDQRPPQNSLINDYHGDTRSHTYHSIPTRITPMRGVKKFMASHNGGVDDGLYDSNTPASRANAGLFASFGQIRRPSEVVFASAGHRRRNSRHGARMRRDGQSAGRA